MRGLVWFRTDLRVDDNLALNSATKKCEEIVGIYIFSQSQWNYHNESNVKLDFLIRNLAILEKSLAKLNIPLIAINTNTFRSLPDALCSFVAQYKIDQIFWNNEFGINESERDHLATHALKKFNIKISRYHDQVIYEPGFLKTGQGKPFSVFTPFKRRWVENFDMNFLDIKTPSIAQKTIKIKSDLSKLKFFKTHNVDMNLWPVGEHAAKKRLKNFLDSKVKDYSQYRNIPILDGTSRISPYLALGVLSPRRCILEGLKLNNFELTSGNSGICKWIDEIVWREFYRNIMHSFPKVSQNKPFQDYTDLIKWRYSKKELQAFFEGKTGFPIVDAGIRQMHLEGWMHNRLRMIVAMFFTKNMLHDWRIGEKFFMKNLIDGDFPSNNGCWQWSASTGTDAAPYFRIFNPYSQSVKFDPDGHYIYKNLPELSTLPLAELHCPSAKSRKDSDYPIEILDLKSSRIRAIEAFKISKSILR